MALKLSSLTRAGLSSPLAERCVCTWKADGSSAHQQCGMTRGRQQDVSLASISHWQVSYQSQTHLFLRYSCCFSHSCLQSDWSEGLLERNSRSITGHVCAHAGRLTDDKLTSHLGSVTCSGELYHQDLLQDKLPLFHQHPWGVGVSLKHTP